MPSDLGSDDEQTLTSGNESVGIRSASRRRPELRWTDASGAHVVTLSKRSTVGTAEGVDLRINDPAVSRLHAEFDVRDDGIWVRDLNSRNGTFIDAVLIMAGRVPNQATIRVGSTSIVTTYPPSPTPVQLWPVDRYGPLIGRSVAMRELFTQIARIAMVDSTVLIMGETGTGKELVARAIHDASPRAHQPMIIVDCASLPENLLESELFGHIKGAFTGASTARAGAIEDGDGGTVFLDEIGELPLAMQPKLLRVIESKTVRRLGESAHRAVDVRFIAATHRDLASMVNVGAFREDLYFRLAVVPITVPPLRSRAEDIVLLTEHFLSVGNGATLAPELLAELSRRPWLGNVRELRNFVERAIALGAKHALASTVTHTSTGKTAVPEIPLDQPYKDVRDQWIDQLERGYIQGLLERHQHNVVAVAQAAGLARTYVHRLIKKHDL